MRDIAEPSKSERCEHFDIAARGQCESSGGSVARLGGVAELGLAQSARSTCQSAAVSLESARTAESDGTAGEVARVARRP